MQVGSGRSEQTTSSVWATESSGQEKFGASGGRNEPDDRVLGKPLGLKRVKFQPPVKVVSCGVRRENDTTDPRLSASRGHENAILVLNVEPRDVSVQGLVDPVEIDEVVQYDNEHGVTVPRPKHRRRSVRSGTMREPIRTPPSP